MFSSAVITMQTIGVCIEITDYWSLHCNHSGTKQTFSDNRSVVGAELRWAFVTRGNTKVDSVPVVKKTAEPTQNTSK